ncbi:MAG: phosphodiester glycosidase family protein [Armatimonadota bacterium]|nr:phosphodiester glycosidase family protein [Armatimonadota bacterium]
MINVLKLDTKNKSVRIESALAGDTVLADDPTNGRETISKLTARRGALAGINADFFPFTGDPLGVAVVNGELVSEPYQGRSAVGISRGGWVLFDKLTFCGQVSAANGAAYKLAGVNRLRGQNELICYTPSFGSTTPARNECIDVTLSCPSLPLTPNATVEAIFQQISNGPSTFIPTDGLVLSGNGAAAKFLTDNFRTGDKVTLKLDMLSEMGKNWTPVVQAVGGGPWLVRYGEVYVDGEAQKFDSKIVLGKHPRTAIGMTANKEMLLVTVDGRQWISNGMSLPELARFMKSLGAVTAVNLDGGGSTTMSIKGLVVNSPCEGVERTVANGLLVFTPETIATTPDIKFSLSQLCSQAGVGQKLLLLDSATGRPIPEYLMSKVVWGIKGGRGFVNQSGHFVPLRVGSGSVIATLGDKRAELSVVVTAGPPSTLTAALKVDPAGDPSRGILEAKLTDSTGNPIAGGSISITVTGGNADISNLQTDTKGIALFGVTWDMATDPSMRSIILSSGILTPVTVKYPMKKSQ